ncbi:MAG: ATP-binding protein, partial [Clostridia bacterium]|nr:ATP-binding protein [Clostridia bacterium]
MENNKTENQKSKVAVKKYDASDIVVLEGLEAVRLRPGMYIGTTGVNGLHHLLWEIVDNSVDEALNGYADTIHVTLNTDGSISVEDNGRGMPVDKHPKYKKSGVELIFTQLHAGGKFDNKEYEFSGGLHGVGASVVNALSDWLEVEVCRDKKIYFQRYEKVVTGRKVKSGIPQGDLTQIGTTKKRGTKTTFKPDATVFETVEFNHDTISKRLKEL